MATAAVIQKDFLTCSICYDVYMSPKCLPCLHNFCLQCLSSYIVAEDETFGVRRRREFPCPVCRSLTKPIEPSKPLRLWANDFKTNFFIENLMREMDISPESATPSEIDDKAATIDPQSHQDVEDGISNTDYSVDVTDVSSINESDWYLNDNSEDHILVRNLPEPMTRKDYKVVKFVSACMPGDQSKPKLCDLCVVADTIVTLDYENKRIKTFSNWRARLDVNISARCFDLPSIPRSVTKISDCQVAVTVPDRKTVYVMEVTECLKVIKVFKTKRSYRNIAHTQQNFFVAVARASGTPGSPFRYPLDLVNYDGITLKSIILSTELRNLEFSNVGVSESGLIHLVRYRDNIVHCVTQDGVELYRYEEKDSRERSQYLTGICCQSDVMYITDFEENSVYEICCDSGLPASREKVLDSKHGLMKPTSVDVSADGTVFVACWDGVVRVYSVTGSHPHTELRPILKRPSETAV